MRSAAGTIFVALTVLVPMRVAPCGETFFVQPVSHVWPTPANVIATSAHGSPAYGVLEGSGEIYITESASSDGQSTARTIAIRIDDERQPVRGVVALPTDQGMELRAFELNVTSREPKDRTAFATAKKDHFNRLLQSDLPGAAWFRHQYNLAHQLSGSRIYSPATSRQFFGRRPNDLLNTYALFSGGRTISENLQLDRMLPESDEQREWVDIDSVDGITIHEMDWKSQLSDRQPSIDPSAKLVPHDQHVIIFPSYRAWIDTLAHLQELVGPLTADVDPYAGYQYIRKFYEQQLMWPFGADDTDEASGLIRAITVTGGDPYFRTGTDVALILESGSPDVLLEKLKLHAAATSGKVGIESRQGAVNKVEYFEYSSPDRTYCAYFAKLDEYVIVTNSLHQLERLVNTWAGEQQAIDSLDEYRFFRDRYPRGEESETGFALISDATIRRWCSPRWRIGASRRARVAGIIAEVQADHLNEILQTTSSGNPPMVYPPFALPVREALIVEATGVRSPTYGNLQFQTPIAELDIREATRGEVNLYTQWRNAYQVRWRNFFDPIAIQFRLKEDSIAYDLSVMPLIEGSDLRPMVSMLRGGKISADQGDRHAPTLLHLAVSLNHQSDTIQMGSNFLANMAPQIGIDPLSWLGQTIAVYVDPSPIWQKLADADQSEWEQLIWKGDHAIPIALCFEVKSGIRLTAFLAGLRAFLEQTAPGMLLWTTEKHENEPYVKIAPSERARASGDVPENSSLYYLAMGDLLLLTPDEAIILRCIDRRLARGKSKESTESMPPIHDWLGDNFCLFVQQDFVSLVDRALTSQRNSYMQQLAWNNLPILNEWKRLYPDVDPLELHKRAWSQQLISPGGGTYRWNDTWKTMESTEYGHPLEPKDGPRVPRELFQLKSMNLGTTFELDGIRVRAELMR